MPDNRAGYGAALRQFRLPLFALLCLLGALVACGQGTESRVASHEVRATLRPTFTPTSPPPTDTPIPPTDTPLPPTDTPLPPTDTPVPTDTPAPTDTPFPTDTPVPPTPTRGPTRKPTDTPVPPTPTRSPVLLREDFDGGLAGGWRPFLNYWRLVEGQWHWSGDGGINGSGALAHNCCAGSPQADDGLMMYLGDGAEGWKDYRVEVQLMVPTEKAQWQGLWFRGQFEERTRKDTAQWVTGYYVMIGRARTVKLLQLQTAEDCRDAACRNPQNLYAFSNPYTLREEQIEGLNLARGTWHHLAVEVRGNSIKIWVNGIFAYEHVDHEHPFLEGTVGMKTYQAEPVLYDNLVVTRLD
jgi:hypothetical protein